MRNIANNIAALLTSHGIIQEDDTDKCRYGLEIFVSSLLELTSILFISIFMNNFGETVLFFAAFIPLRVYAGGYHADTQIKCYMVSLGVYGLFTMLMRIMPTFWYTIIIYISIAMSLIIVLMLAPVRHTNKTLTPQETKIYREISVVICTVEAIITLFGSIMFGGNTWIVAFALGISAETLSMIAAVIKKAVKHKKRLG